MLIPKVKVREPSLETFVSEPPKEIIKDIPKEEPKIMNNPIVNTVIEPQKVEVVPVETSKEVSSIDSNKNQYVQKRTIREGDIVLVRYVPFPCYIAKISNINLHVALVYSLDFRYIGYTQEEDLFYSGITIDEGTLNIWNNFSFKGLPKKKKFKFF